MEQHGLQENRKRTLHLHIGIPKTATSWLQTKVFPQLDHILYLGCPRSGLFNITDNVRSKERFLGEIFRRSSLIWKGYGNEIFEELIGDRQKWLADERDLLISEENIGRQGSRPVLLAAHIHELKIIAREWGFERLNIICCIRRQDQWLASHYAQMSNRNVSASQQDFETFVNKTLSPRLSRYEFGMLLDYDILYDHLLNVVGKEQLFILVYETLEKSPDTFLKILLQILNTPSDKIKEIIRIASGSKANVRSEPKHVTWHLTPKNSRIGSLPLIRMVFKARPNTIHLTPEITHEIIKSYLTGNQKLSKKANLDLELHGYYDMNSVSNM